MTSMHDIYNYLEHRSEPRRIKYSPLFKYPRRLVVRHKRKRLKFVKAMEKVKEAAAAYDKVNIAALEWAVKHNGGHGS